MQLRSCAYSLAILASVTLPAVAVTSAHAANCEDLSWSKDQLSKFDAAMASEHGATRQSTASQISEIDAAIASLEQDVSTRKGEAAAKGEAMLKQLRAGRDAYQVKLDQPATRVMSAATADTGQSADQTANALWDKVDAYLDAVNADISTREAATQTRFMGD
jgi:hypothetical protein